MVSRSNQTAEHRQWKKISYRLGEVVMRLSDVELLVEATPVIPGPFGDYNDDLIHARESIERLLVLAATKMETTKPEEPKA